MIILIKITTLIPINHLFYTKCMCYVQWVFYIKCNFNYWQDFLKKQQCLPPANEHPNYWYWQVTGDVNTSIKLKLSQVSNYQQLSSF